MGVTHLAEQREKAGHILTLGKPKKRLAQTITRDIFPQSTEGKDRRKGLKWPP